MQTISQMLDRARAERRSAARRRMIRNAITLALAMILSAAIGAVVVIIAQGLASRSLL